MNAVNLLPAKHRPKAPTGGQQGSAYAVVGVLGVILVMVLLYVLTVNGINTRKDSVARAKAETAQAEKRVKDLAAYGNFNQVKEERVSSVKQLASGRIDWERMALGLAHVLPHDVWLTSANASGTGKQTGAGTSGSADTAGKPSLVLNGCANDKQQIAVALVRLRELSGAEDVQLANITQPEGQQGGAAGGNTGGSAGSGGAQDCGQTHGKLNYSWSATVVFKPTPGSAPADGKVPARLGGGQ